MYDFDEKLAQGHVSERWVTTALMRAGCHVEPGHNGWDRVVDGVRVEIKRDETADRTGRLAIESISVIEKGETKARGWAYTSPAAYILVHLPLAGEVYVLDTARLRAMMPAIATRYEKRYVQSQRGGRRWATEFYAPTIRWLTMNGIIAGFWQAKEGGAFRLPQAQGALL